jgi:hypothetical protein
MSHSKEINETSIRQLQITHVELKLYSDACSEPTNCVASNHANYKSSYVGYYTKAEIQVLQQSQRFPHHPGRPFGRREPRSPPYSQIMFSPSASPKVLLQRTPMSVLVKKKRTLLLLETDSSQRLPSRRRFHLRWNLHSQPQCAPNKWNQLLDDHWKRSSGLDGDVSPWDIFHTV